MTQTLDDFFSVENPPPPDQLWFDLRDMIQARHEATPRHQQVELGPSEIPNPCMRKLAYAMMQVPRCNPEYDPLPSIIGTATHSWLESAAQLNNEELGRQRWLTETRINVTAGLSGSCDLFDTDTGTVIDFKVLGYTSFSTQRKDISPIYRGQVHLYGKGFRNAGHTVNSVAVAILPRAGTLSKMHLWTEDYNESLVQEILLRRNAVIALINDLEVEANPDRYQWIPITPNSCLFCPYFRPEPQSPFQCQGDA